MEQSAQENKKVWHIVAQCSTSFIISFTFFYYDVYKLYSCYCLTFLPAKNRISKRSVFGTVQNPKSPSLEDLVQELRDLPRNVCVRRVNEVVARARAVKVHLALGALAAIKLCVGLVVDNG